MDSNDAIVSTPAHTPAQVQQQEPQPPAARPLDAHQPLRAACAPSIPITHDNKHCDLCRSLSSMHCVLRALAFSPSHSVAIGSTASADRSDNANTTIRRRPMRLAQPLSPVVHSRLLIATSSTTPRAPTRVAKQRQRGAFRRDCTHCRRQALRFVKREAAKVHGRVERFLTALHGREDFGEVLRRGVLLKGVMERRIGWCESEARKIEEDAVVEREADLLARLRI